ncbi:MAG: hypothetical protein K2N88_00820 [Muribaculaceae bacterium]|nr:hypothetical protein [Muribaculaceae bacterium]
MSSFDLPLKMNEEKDRAGRREKFGRRAALAGIYLIGITVVMLQLRSIL